MTAQGKTTALKLTRVEKGFYQHEATGIIAWQCDVNGDWRLSAHENAEPFAYRATFQEIRRALADHLAAIEAAHEEALAEDAWVANARAIRSAEPTEAETNEIKPGQFTQRAVLTVRSADGTEHEVSAVMQDGQVPEPRVYLDSETGHVGSVEIDVFTPGEALADDPEAT